MDYEPVKYDLSDLVPRAQGLLKGFNDSSIARLRMREMAARAGAKAVKTFSILGQLDALMYAILKVIMPPVSGLDWHCFAPLQCSIARLGRSGLSCAICRNIANALVQAPSSLHAVYGLIRVCHKVSLHPQRLPTGCHCIPSIE